MKSFFMWASSMAIAVITVAGILLQATHPGLYNIAHFLAIIGAGASIIIFPIFFIGFTAGQNDVINNIMANKDLHAKYLAIKPIGIIRRIFGIIWSMFFIILYASQGWYIVTFLFLVSFLFLQITIPYWNQTVRKIHDLIELRK